MQEQTIAHSSVSLSFILFFSVCVCAPTPTPGAASFSKPLGRPDSQLREHQGRQRAEQTHPFLLTREQRGLACVSTCVHVSVRMCKGDIISATSFVLVSAMQCEVVVTFFCSIQ